MIDDSDVEPDEHGGNKPGHAPQNGVAATLWRMDPDDLDSSEEGSA